MNEKQGQVNKLMFQLLGVIPPDTVEINGKTVEYYVYEKACEYAQRDKRLAELLEKLIVEYVDLILERERKQRERIRKEVEALAAAGWM